MRLSQMSKSAQNPEPRSSAGGVIAPTVAAVVFDGTVVEEDKGRCVDDKQESNSWITFLNRYQQDI